MLRHIARHLAPFALATVLAGMPLTAHAALQPSRETPAVGHPLVGALVVRQAGLPTRNMAPARPQVGGCNQYAVAYHYWWGTEIYYNDCYLRTAAIGGAIASVFLPYLAPGLAIGIGALLWLDGNCGGRGAYLDMPWGTPPFPHSVC